MHILITGGTGFIGQALVPALLADGHTLTLLSRQPQKHRPRLGGKVQLIARLAEIADHARLDAVINLAGEGIADRPWTAARRQLLYDSRITLTQDLVRWLARRAAPPAVMISGSAVGWYGDQEDAALTEASAAHDEYTHTLCNAWENAARAVEAQGTRLCLLRIGVVLGREGGMLKRLLPVFRAGLGGRIGSGRQWLSWIAREDLLALIRRLLSDASLSGVFNATAPTPVTNADFTRTLATQLGRPALLPVPALALKLSLGDMSSLLLGGQKVLPARLQAAGFTFAAPTLEACLRRELR
ncbi:MAG: TIGR01777 family oxidoreductase [Pseudomonadota bacterium]